VEKNKGKTQRPVVFRVNPEVDGLVDDALALVEKGKLKEGEALLVDLVRQHPDLYMTHYGLGAVLGMEKRYEEALVSLNKCLDLNPYLVEAWFNKALSHKELLDIRDCVRSLQMVEKYGDPEEEFVLTASKLLETFKDVNLKESGLSQDEYFHYMEIFNQGFLCMKNKNYEQALGLFTEVVNGYPNHYQSHGNIGLCYMYLGKNEEALAALDRALEIDPSYEPAIQNRDTLLSLPAGKTILEGGMKVVDYYRDVVSKIKEKLS
jgi:tetratricopeptide (TPR) repeat protein